MINPGYLRHKITIQKQNNNSDKQDDYGQPLDIWVDVARSWASINPISGKEIFAAETVSSEITHKIKIRYRSGITPDMRIVFNGRIFEIKSIINFQERNIDLQLMCKELV